MEFINDNIDYDSLPDIKKLDYKNLDKNSLKTSRIHMIFTMFILIIIPIVIYLAVDEFTSIKLLLTIIGVLIIITVLLFLYKKTLYENKAWCLRNKDISYKHGYIRRTISTIPFNKVQHISTSQGLLSKFFNLKSINIYTAGNSAFDLTIKGLNNDDAERIKEFINNKISLNKDE